MTGLKSRGQWETEGNEVGVVIRHRKPRTGHTHILYSANDSSKPGPTSFLRPSTANSDSALSIAYVHCRIVHLLANLQVVPLSSEMSVLCGVAATEARLVAQYGQSLRRADL